MKRALLNYWVDMATGAALLVCAATGIVRMFPEATMIASGSATILGVSAALWATVHDWSGVVMATGVALHTVLHLPWLAHMTCKVVRGEDLRSAAERTRPARRAASPQAAAAASLSRLEDMGRDGGDDEPLRMDRRAFLTGAAALGGVAILGGAGLLLRSGTQAVASTGTPVADTASAAITSSTTSSTTSAAESGTSAGSGSTSASSTASSGTNSTARVVVAADACVGCGHCLQACPHGVFSFESGKAVASNAGPCSLCGRCVQVCQPQAITLNG